MHISRDEIETGPCAGAALAARDGPEVIHAVVTKDYRPSGRTLAHAGEHVRLLDEPTDFHVWIYREGKKYGRGIRSDHLRIVPRAECLCRAQKRR